MVQGIEGEHTIFKDLLLDFGNHRHRRSFEGRYTTTYPTTHKRIEAMLFIFMCTVYRVEDVCQLSERYVFRRLT